MPHETVQWLVRAMTSGDEVKAYVRRHQISIGAPLHFDPEYGRVTAFEYVLAAIAADVIGGFFALAKKRRLEVDTCEATAIGEVDDPLAALGVVGAEGHPGVKQVGLRIYASTFSPENEVRAVFAEALARSPLARTFGEQLAIELKIVT